MGRVWGCIVWGIGCEIIGVIRNLFEFFDSLDYRWICNLIIKIFCCDVEVEVVVEIVCGVKSWY